MNAPDTDSSKGGYVSTPQGIFTPSGVWFSATEEALHDYADAVLRYVPLPVLLRRAERWLRAPQTLALWTLPLFLWLIPPLPAALAALAVYAGGKMLCPAVASRYGAAALSVLEQPLVQGLYYVFVLSVLAAQARYVAVFVGLAGFVLLRWGLVRRATQPLVQPFQRSLYPLPISDQVLRAFLVRAALQHGVDLPQVRRIEERFLDLWQRRDT